MPNKSILPAETAPNMAGGVFRLQPFFLEFPSGKIAVRQALSKLKTTLIPLHLSSDDLSSVEVVLGEVLNNVVEHAYGANAKGAIQMSCTVFPHVLRFTVEDEGCALPRGALPRGELPDLNASLEAMPEGGFGWYLVRNLTCDLHYRRHGSRNIFAFSIPYSGCA